MDLKKDIIPRIWFYRLIKLIASGGIIYLIWSATTTVDEYNTFFEDESTVERFEFDGLSFHRQTILRGEEEELVRYVTVSDLSYEAAEEVRQSILESNFGDTKMIGLQSAPSFFIQKEQRAFWQQFIYQKIFLFFGGLAALMGLLIVWADLNFKQESKLFTKEVKYLIYITFFGVYAYALLDTFMYGKMIHFLNKEFSLGESLVGGSLTEMTFLGVALLILAGAIQKAIPIQKEQELTV